MHNSTFSSFFYKLLITLSIVASALAGTPVQPAYAATLTVNSTADSLNNADGVCTLREAITNANADLNTWTNCGSGTGNDTIEFNIASASPTITLGSALPNIADIDGLTVDGTNLNVLGGTVRISGNNAVRIVSVSALAPATFQDLTFSGAQSGNGAAINNSGTLTVTNVTFSNNTSTANGGAIFIAAGGTLTVSNSTFSGNTAAFGGAIYHNGTSLLTVTNSTFTGNALSGNVAGDGGAIELFTAGSSALINGSTFISNAAQDDGGAIYSNGTSLTVTSSSFQTNSAGNAGLSAGTGTDGGAIRNTAGSAAITLSTFINNTISMPANVAIHGGAVENDGTMIIANSTFTGNTISQTAAGTANSSGGAVYASVSTTIQNSTFSGNSVSENGTGFATGGSVHSTGSSVTIANSILAGGTENGAPGSCGGTVLNGGNNVEFGSNDCGFAITGDPVLGALTGSPAYYPLGAGSSALDAGNNTICANASGTNNQSQNGVNRPQNGICDIGSYESPNNTPTVSTPIADVNVLEDAANTVFSLYPNFADAESSDAQLAYTVTANTNPSLFTSVNITDPTNFTLDYAPDTSGTADITIRATDTGGLYVEDTFTVTVTAVNDAPSFVMGGNQAVLEDAAAQSVPGWATSISAGPADEVGQTLTFIVTNDNNALFSVQPAIVADGTLIYTPVANANGVATITVSLQDNGGTANGGVDTYTPVSNTFTITVTAVNDMPDFTGFNPPAVNEDSGPQSTSIISTTDLGPADEDASQSVLAYLVSNSTCGTLLSAGPSVDPSGVLAYTPAANQNGSCTFDLQLRDNGGTANGGVDTSPAHSFTITVNSLNDAPTDISLSNASIAENNTVNDVIGILSATDVDAGDTFVFSLTCAAPGADDASFNISGTNLRASAVFDFETKNSYSVCIRVTDQGGSGSSFDKNFTISILDVDESAPDTTITSNPSDPSTSNSASFSFTGVDFGGSGVAGFECSLDGALFTACTSPQTYTGLSDAVHNFAVRAIDGVGNVDASPDTFMWTVDTAAPTVTINQAAAQSDPTSTSPINFTVVFSEAVNGFDGSDIDLSASTVGGTLSVSVSGSGPTYTVSVTGMTTSGDVVALIPAGAAGDTAGNNSAASTSTDNTVSYIDAAPTVTIDQASGQSDPTNSSPIQFTVIFSEPVNGFTGSSVDLSASTAGGTLVANVSGSGPTYTVNVTGMTSGGDVVATIPANAVTDSVGNPNAASTSSDNTVTYDNTLPDTTIDSMPSNPSSSATAAFTFSSTASDLAGFECKLDSGAFAACTSPQNYSGLSSGSHTFQVRAVDTSGNVDPSPASFTWTVDVGFPTVSSATPANNATVTPGLTQLKVTFSEDVKNDGSAGAANNTANYILVENGANNVFNTISCVGGVVPDDTNIAIVSASYSNNGGSGPFVATLTVPALTKGTYRLFVCGTTSIEDLSGNKLNNGASDATITFTVAPSTPEDGGKNARKSLPATGFAMNQVTVLPAQPADKAYASTDLWLEIPALHVKMSIVGVPFKEGGWDVKWLDKNAGWLNGSAYPTWSGNSVITGHVWDALNRPGPFADLKKLKYGDQIKIHAFGNVYIYEVRASESITSTDTSTVFKHEENSWITLVTCEDYQERSQTYLSRRMVRAVLVRVTAEK